jgi:ADP-ribose pyrophosphatase
MPPQAWKTLTAREVYRKKWIHLHEDLAELPNGRTTIYGVCEFGECARVLAFVDQRHVLMVRQYRYMQKENHRWEMPTGGIQPGETPEQAAQRELMEEGGGRHLQPAEAPPDETEFIERAVPPFKDVLRMVERSESCDSMTVIAVLHAARMQASGGEAPAA